jgi:hypothetical protein
MPPRERQYRMSVIPDDSDHLSNSRSDPMISGPFTLNNTVGCPAHPVIDPGFHVFGNRATDLIGKLNQGHPPDLNA